MTPHFQRCLLTLGVISSTSLALPFSLVLADEPAPLPEDLISDEHVREEFGVNDFTAPSIERIFKDLESLGDLPYESLGRKLPEEPPRERAFAAFSLGTLIADGLLTVQCEQRGDLKPIGQALKAHAEALGADKRMTRHTKSLVEHSLNGDWPRLKKELAMTQDDVEAELVLLRDVEMAHLISLGGWLRAFEIACTTLQADFDEEKVKSVMRYDVADYFISEMETLRPELLAQEKVAQLREGIIALRKSMDLPKSGHYSKEQVVGLRKEVALILAKALKKPEPTPTN